jgi:hypothetical protein
MTLNRRLPRITARDVLSSVLFVIVHLRNGPMNLSGVETFPGAACSKRFEAIHAPRRISWDLLARRKAALRQALARIFLVKSFTNYLP